MADERAKEPTEQSPTLVSEQSPTLVTEQSPTLVSVVVPVYNEGAYIESLIASLVGQDVSAPIEILLVDGGSTDNTVELALVAAKRLESDTRRVKVLHNPKRRSPSAMNVGIGEATGEYIAYFGAHAFYDANYLRCCVEHIRASGEDRAYGGLIRTLPATEHRSARLVVDVLSSRFASSGSSFRTQQSGPVDNIPFPVMQMNDVRRTGLYNELLGRNEDNEYNGRLRKNGVQLHITSDTGASYYPVRTIRALARYAFRNGWWNMRTVALGFGGLKARHFIPAVFTAGVAGTALVSLAAPRTVLGKLARVAFGSALVAHLATGTSSTVRESGHTRGFERLLIAPVILVFHLAYGAGTLSYPLLRKEP
jgi:glycosyltransferase involved in cell wall biosynthesis